jgi:glycine/D-amino acid oxidase-like deaminating enzyme
VGDIDPNQSVWAADKPPYHPAAPLTAGIDADVAIIGGGFTGVSTALHLAKRFPDRRIVLLEARQIANGASGRNGGMVLNWVNGIECRDPESARRIYDVTRGGIDLIESIIHDHRLQVPWRRDGCLEVFTDPARAAAAARRAEWLNAAGIPIRFLSGAELAATVKLAGATGALLDPHAGQLDGVAYLRALRPVLLDLGVILHENTPVTSIEEGTTCTVGTPNGRVRAKAIVLATNAYTPALGYFRGGILPLH